MTEHTVSFYRIWWSSRDLVPYRWIYTCTCGQASGKAFWRRDIARSAYTHEALNSQETA